MRRIPEAGACDHPDRRNQGPESWHGQAGVALLRHPPNHKVGRAGGQQQGRNDPPPVDQAPVAVFAQEDQDEVQVKDELAAHAGRH